MRRNNAVHLLWTSALGANAGQKNRTIERIEARRVVQRSADDYADIARLASLVRLDIERGAFIDDALSDGALLAHRDRLDGTCLRVGSSRQDEYPAAGFFGLGENGPQCANA